MARPATAPIKLKDGFYIELRNQGGLKGIKTSKGVCRTGISSD